MSDRLYSRLVETAVILLCLCAAACAVPLAPGYRIVKESRAIEFVPGSPSSLKLRFVYILQNSGTATLDFLDVSLPDSRAFGRKDLRVAVDGREVTAGPLPAEYQAESPLQRRILLDPAWRQGQARRLEVEYTLSSPEDSGSSIGIGANDFHLGARGWSAVLEPPRHVLSPFPHRSVKMDYTVRVPRDFLVLARGAAKGRKNDGDAMEYRFELRKQDLPPYVVAGRYVATGSRATGAVLWNAGALNGDPTATMKALGQAWATLVADFGPLDVNVGAPHIVESPELRGHIAGESGPAAASFPGGALMNPAALALGVNSESFLETATHGLAHNWFGSEMYPNPLAAIGMGEGLPDYATIVIDEARGGPAARQRRVAEYLRGYDAACKLAVEKPLGLTMMADPPEQRRIALEKAPLFFIALEDQYGEEPVRAGLRQLVTILRGQQAGYNELRSALEDATGKSLSGPFDRWLYQKGVPDDFRARYGASE